MGKRPKQTFLQRNTDSQEALGKMLNITNYHRNADQNYNEVLPHISQNGCVKKIYKQLNARQGEEKREHSYLGGNVTWYNHCGEEYGDSFKI